jgi:hypothetical protein
MYIHPGGQSASHPSLRARLTTALERNRVLAGRIENAQVAVYLGCDALRGHVLIDREPGPVEPPTSGKR